MADHFRAMVRLYDTANPNRRDDCVNVLHFRNGGTVPITDYNALASDLTNIYALRMAPLLGGINTVEARFYNLDDAEPRPVRGLHLRTVSKLGVGPRELACCLSFYAERNLPRQRGRIYVGPLAATQTNAERPGAGLRNAVFSLAPDFAGLGGANIDWVMLSRAASLSAGEPIVHQITHAWVDDEWDVQRRRGLRSTTRTEGDVSG